MDVALAAILHDPPGALQPQAERTLPALTRIFAHIAVRATGETRREMLDRLRAAGVEVTERPSEGGGWQKLGLARADSVQMAAAAAPHVLYCDFDRALHWAEHFPDELALAAQQITACDFTVLGRTARAFGAHPAVQRDTEHIINRVFALVSGQGWDVGAGARGLSRRAAAAVLAGCRDEGLSSDVSWPLFLQAQGGFTLQYLSFEGLEFETPDRHAAEVQAAGGLEAWMQAFDADPRRWLERLELASGHLRAMMAFLPPEHP